ncbi:hypothetical protein HNV08_00765 [Winogradskyella eckloniae]|uniref:hypothetical protein n=1 Tax=Winogradskyella eckloniae TaxID=1089306 RepID=UPI0015635641|nr:hypothetical protein [Winogradskyella eckloniae]NRD18561.1 hypothetical protein [Winogradskyella eckloniae]
MGLAEKRVAKAFEANEFESILKDIKNIVGKDITVNVDWKTLSTDGMSHLYNKAWPSVYFEPLTNALKSICQDDMGKDALNDELETIIIKNEAGNSSANTWASFENKTLTLDHKPTTNVHYVAERTKSLQTLLENNL